MKKEYKEKMIIMCRGCTIGKREQLWSNFGNSIFNGEDNSYLRLVPEPSNQYDENAIQVISKGEVYGTVGYVGREYTLAVKEILKNNKDDYRIDLANIEEIGNKEITLILSY